MQGDVLTNRENEPRIGPTIRTDTCKHVLYRQSDCQVCVDTCPENAISLPFGPELSDACTDCGLCQVVCPTDVFESDQKADQMLIDLFEDKSDKQIINHRLYIHCEQAEKANALSVAVNCLGNITENALLAIAGGNVQTLLLSTGNCDSCQLCQGKELFKQSATTYKRLSKEISRPALTIKTRVSEKQKNPQKSSVDRRAFFRSLGTGVAKQAVKVVFDKEQQIKALLQTDDDTSVQKRPSPRREMLKALLKEPMLREPLLGKNCDDSFDVLVDESLGYMKMLVDVPHCVGCGVCVNVCPTGALVKELDDLELTRFINYSLCNNCGVCAEACPQNVISFEKAYSLNDLINDGKEVVAKVALTACMICGEIIPVSEGEVCTTCQKRQVVPMFM